MLFLLHSLFKASTHLIWSVFGLTNLETLESHDIRSNTVVGILFVMFLVLSVIMLINMLVALFTNTYNKVEVNNLAVTFDQVTFIVQALLAIAVSVVPPRGVRYLRLACADK